MPRPVFFLVPGAYCTPKFYSPLRERLSANGYTSIAIDLPSVNAKPPTHDFSEDVQAIRAGVTKLAEAGEEIVVVMHSYSGLPGGEALKGLGKISRVKNSLKGGVVRLVFIMSFLVPEGFQLARRGDTSKFPPIQVVDLEAGISTADPKLVAEVYFNDMPKEEQEYWSARLLPVSVGVLWSKTSYAAWREIPTTFVLCEKDLTVPIPYVDHAVAEAQASTPNMIDTVERNATAGHFVMLSQPDWTAALLRRAAGD